MKILLFIAVLIVSGVFTSCTDSSEEIVDLLEKEVQLNVGGEDDHDPDEDPDA